MSKVPRCATALVMSLTLAVTGCATTGGKGLTVVPSGNRAVVAEFVQKLPQGSAIRVQHTDGRTLRGILMKATDQSLVIQPRVRVPEPPIEISLADVVAVTPDSNGGTNLAKAIGIGAAAGAGAALAVFLIIAAIYAD